MCQNWFSVLGQLLDVVGFLVIAREWYHEFSRDHDKRIGQLQSAYERQSAKMNGETYEGPDSDEDNWSIYQKLFLEEWSWRRKVFFTGATLVILGFICQMFGSWPGAIKAC